MVVNTLENFLIKNFMEKEYSFTPIKITSEENSRIIDWLVALWNLILKLAIRAALIISRESRKWGAILNREPSLLEIS